jgi:uncharacterized protein YndB with AHSA1/START domain
MGPVSAEVGIDLPRQRVFEFLADLANRPSFTDHFIDDFRLFREESTGVGAGARFRLRSGPGAVWMDTTIEAVEAPRFIRERGRGGRFNRIPVQTVWELREGPGPLTTVRVTFWSEPDHLLNRARELVGGASLRCRRHWASALRRLRDVVEGEAAVKRVAVAGADRIPLPVSE